MRLTPSLRPDPLGELKLSWGGEPGRESPGGEMSVGIMGYPTPHTCTSGRRASEERRTGPHVRRFFCQQDGVL